MQQGQTGLTSLQPDAVLGSRDFLLDQLGPDD